MQERYTTSTEVKLISGAKLMKVKLQDIIDGMEMQFDGLRTFLSRKSGLVVSISEDVLRDAEEIEEDEIVKLIEWQQDDMRRAIDILENYEDYEELPTKYEVNEYDMMVEFCYSIDDKKQSETLLREIQGRGAFRRFKDKVSHLRIEDVWYKYRDECYKKKAVEWCEDNNLKYE